ncbi:dihydrofolate reductase, partial [Pseudomonas aeruginosa]
MARPLAMIAALGENRAIGIDNRLPWRLPADLKHFKAMTLGKQVIMGRQTWDLPIIHISEPTRRRGK